MSGRDWRRMTRADFDVEADEPDTLFDLSPDGVRPVADDGHGTGDLLDDLTPDQP